MDSFKTRIDEAKILASDNEGGGFFRTVENSKDSTIAKRLFYQASNFLMKKFKGADPKNVRDFLDSGYGRHVADEVVDGHKMVDAFKNYFRSDAKLKKEFDAANK